MLLVRTRVEQIAERVGRESFRDPEYLAIYQALIAAGPDATIEEVASHLDEDSVATVEEIVGEGAYQINPEQTIGDSLAELQARELDGRLAEIDRITPLASADQIDKLIAEKQELSKELRGTGKKYFKAFRRKKPRLPTGG